MALAVIARNANHNVQLEHSIADNKLKTVLLRSVSHELRTPINVIAYTDELVENLFEYDDSTLQEKLKMVSVSAKLLITLVNDLLDYSRMLAGVFSIQKSEFKLKEVIMSTIDLIRIQAKKKNIKISLRIDHLIPEYIYSDPLRLSQVLLNLLSNALKFTLRGSIEVICVSTISNRLKIMVKDTGLGIESTKLTTIFQEFNTTVSPTINPQGCGLGLHISNMIVKELGNKSLEVQSKINIGSTFTFTIEISRSIQSSFSITDSIKLSISDEIDSLFDKTINHTFENDVCRQVLIVDDNDFNRIILVSLLSKNGISFSEACTGKEAVDLVLLQHSRGRQYKVVLMDGDMPELTGWDATRAIMEMRKNGQISLIPAIIGYTAFSSEDDIRRCIESGMINCLTKPCSAELLLSTIMRYLT